MGSDKIKLTVIIPVYNEELRIANTLDSLISWADEIIVFDKSSTDETKVLVEKLHPSVKVVQVPYSGKGEEDFNVFFEYVSNDWVFLCTCSEVVTRKLVSSLSALFESEVKAFDLIYVPRKFYSLGFHNENSPWSYAHYPFLFNKTRVTVTNVIHEHFKVLDKGRERFLTPEKHGFVNHVTHNGVDDYLSSMCEYVKLEVAGIDKKQINNDFFRNSYKQFSLHSSDLKNGGVATFGQYCAWTMYWHGVMLYAWEKCLDEDLGEYNQYLLDSFKTNEWTNENVDLRSVGVDISDIKLSSFVMQKIINFATKLYRHNRKYLLVRKFKEWLS